jgi:hypothetical protein
MPLIVPRIDDRDYPRILSDTLARIPVEALEPFTDVILEMSEDELVRKYHLSPQEAETLGPALLAYLQSAQAFNLDDVLVTNTNLRDGLLQEMAAYADSAVCRRKQLLHYFGEYLSKDCGYCDNCINPKEQFEGKEYVELALQAALQTGQRFGINHLVAVIRGSENQYVSSYDHDKLAVHGKGKDHDEQFWSSVLRQTLLFEFLDRKLF